MRLTSTGLGIGTTSPGVSLDVEGSGIRIKNATPNIYFNNTVVQWKAYMPTGLNSFAINDAVRDVLTLGYNGAASYFSGCNVGIGTTSPNAKLVVSDAGLTGMELGVSDANNRADIAVFDRGESSYKTFRVLANDITFKTNQASVDAVVINSSANVGIGTTSPAYKLDVQGSAGNIARITDGTNHFLFYAGSGLNEIATVSPLLLTVAGTERLRITSGGNVGVNCTAVNAKLEVVATSGEVFRADSASGAYRIVATQTGVNMQGKINFASLPTSATGLSAGDIWNDGGTLKIV
jgi:hypothetical protein